MGSGHPARQHQGTVTVQAAPLVDSHVHIFRRNMPLVPDPRHAPGYEFTAEQLEATLAGHGVAQCVIAAASPWGDCNDYVIEALRTRPHWRGTVILDPERTNRYELEAMARDGIVGMRLAFIGLQNLPDLEAWAWRKLLYRLADMNWHVHLHLDGPRIPLVLPHLEQSGVNIVIDHIGRPDPVQGVNSEGFQAVVRSIEKGRTWVKLSAAYRLGPQAADQARALCDQVGFERMLWASDCPFVGVENTTYQSTLDWFTDVVPNAAMRQRIGGENALKLFFSHRA